MNIDVKDYLLGLWKTFVVTATGLVVAWLANRGIHLSDTTTSVITIALVSAGLSLYNLIVNWLLARAGTSLLSRAARLIGKVLSLGGEAPKYAPPAVTR